jgi:hypothetical protein
MNVNCEVEGEKVVMHERVIQRPDMFQELQRVDRVNPYWEYDKNAMIAREIEMGKEWFEKNYPKIPVRLLKEEIDYHTNDENHTKITFYLELI